MSHLRNCSVKIFKEHCEYFTKKCISKTKRIKKMKKGGTGRGRMGEGDGCEPITEVILKMPKQSLALAGWGGGGRSDECEPRLLYKLL